MSDDGDEAVFLKAVEVLGTPPEKPKRDERWRDKLLDAAGLRDLARSHGKWGINRLAEIAKDASVPVTVQVDCIKILLERGFGRVKAAEDESGSNEIRITIRNMLGERMPHLNGGGKVIDGKALSSAVDDGHQGG